MIWLVPPGDREGSSRREQNVTEVKRRLAPPTKKRNPHLA
jgi:hypothetical protein